MRFPANGIPNQRRSRIGRAIPCIRSGVLISVFDGYKDSRGVLSGFFWTAIAIYIKGLGRTADLPSDLNRAKPVFTARRAVVTKLR